MFYLKGKAMSLLTLGWRRKVSAVKVEAKEEQAPRGVLAMIAACDTNKVYVYNHCLRVRTLEHPVEGPLNERQLEAVEAYRQRLVDSVAEDFAYTAAT
jgi:hypothetical protein